MGNNQPSHIAKMLFKRCFDGKSTHIEEKHTILSPIELIARADRVIRRVLCLWDIRVVSSTSPCLTPSTLKEAADLSIKNRVYRYAARDTR